MDWFLAVSFGEIFLKGRNRNTFYKTAINNIKRNIRDIGYDDMFQESSKLYIKADRDKFDRLIKEIKKVFGIVYISEVVRCEKTVEDISKTSINLVKYYNFDTDMTFKVESKRTDKSFALTSPKLSAKIGGDILGKYNGLSVDIHEPDFTVFIDVKSKAYIYIKRVEGLGGLPLGSGGEGLLLLSGGIDSPVAGFLMAKRGMNINAIHFHSYPFTSKRAHQKAMDLAKILSAYTGKMTVYSVNLAEIYKAISKNCPRRETTILSRRFMMRIANKISEKYYYQALITGESLGQVASQTIESVSVINDSSKLPILRPLIAMDKKDIIEISEKIDSYEKAIEPYDDCCSIFAPDSPVTKPKLKYIEKSEENLDIEKLENQAIETMEIIEIA
ncbi:Probable tRNA sulfurtransferase [Anaerococcus prevotii]|uniref:Probable tRNA sulfurtransferase n=1 Tax=Anaerococcus prevotii (strain ATCC 9321 / DSM 20548 / JCM 6508 / NCTC 11806 / PC1) TaxID=525919 RepID=C7RHJ2_ANAPD|nr:tRNA uracil 4-sulfurtransferase ThiI [Anaerococcus prevotii]ACV28953.1 thiamine biosynthesis/tRNA modification protein ThiI [Anaerococcus prevotii DSM 20548]SUU94626.1 Probable tRNA sulfurtransferase [Anaerococcus prevotii]